MNEYIYNLDELLYLATKKCHLVQHLKKNYKENVHYVTMRIDVGNQHGGHNKLAVMLTKNAFELLKNSYNLRNRYIVDAVDNFKQVNIVQFKILNLQPQVQDLSFRVLVWEYFKNQ